MNYIPGFSNYLEASVPEYGPAPIMDAPRQPAVEPMTQEAVAPAAAPYSLSGLTPEALAGLYALSANNAGGSTPSGMAGLPSLGAGYVPQFEEKLITAPVSNKGNATAYSGMDNQFYMSPNDLVRLVDRSTNTVVFEGTGYEAAQKAVELGQGMTDAMGRKADYQIETGKTQDSYAPVANEKYNKSTVGSIANAIGTVAPLAAAFIPGLNLGVLGSIGAGAGLGGASAALKGDNILKGAAMGGLSAAGGQLLGPALEAGGGALAPRLATAVGTGLGSTAGGLVTGQNLKNALTGGVISGGLSYLAPDITKELGIGAGSNASSTGGGGVDPSAITVSGYTAPSISVPFSGSPSGAQPAPAKVQDPYDGLNVIGDKFGNLAGVDVGNVFGAPTGPVSAFDQMFRAEQPVAAETPAEDIIKVTGQLPGAVAPSVDLGAGLAPQVIDKIAQPAETLSPEEILVEARKSFNPVSVTSPLATDFIPKNVLADPAPTETVSPEEILVEARKSLTPSVPTPALSPEVLRAVEGNDIVVTGNRPGAVPSVTIPGIDTPVPDMTQPAEVDKKLTAKDIADYLRLASLGISTVGGLLGGGKGGGSTGTIPAGMGALSSLFSKQLPASTLPGGVGGGALPASTLASQGFNSPQNYYRYGYGPEQSFFDYATQGAPNTSRAYTGYEGTTAEDMFAPQPMRMSQPTLPQPITTPIPNNPAGPIMQERDPMRFAQGGYAVEGAGDGRDDQIPALLSDGEYVIDAETVALLGNGSNKAGAELLDSFRVNVRKQKGKKLARGEFSDNAKRPEHYMAGGHA